MMVYERRGHGPYEWCDDLAPDDCFEGVEMGRCAVCGYTRFVKVIANRRLCKGCAMDAGLYQESGI